MKSILADLRYAIRVMFRQPGFALVALLTLALGIGANTAVFSVIKAVLLNPLPYEHPEELAVVWTNFGADLPQNWISGPELVEMQEFNSTVQYMEALVFNTVSVTGAGEPEQVQTGLVSGEFFQLLAVKPALGRLVTHSDDVPGSAPVAVLSNGYWKRRFGSAPGIVGTTINVSGFPVQVVGVLPPEFGILHPELQGSSNLDLWLPLRPILPTVFQVDDYARLPRGAHFIRVVARLKPGVSMERFQSDLDAVAARIQEKSPDYYDFEGWGITGKSLHEDLVEEVKPALLVLMGAVGFVLLIACVNVANLLLARAATREREIAIRTALGAGRSRLFRQLLTESVALASAGALAGLLLATVLIRLLEAFSPPGLPRGSSISIDLGVLVFTLGIGLLTGILFGLAPVFHGFREKLVESLKEGGRGSSTGLRQRILRTALVAVEVALALVLLIGAGLMIKSFNRLLAADPGYEVSGRLTLNINLPQSRYGADDQIRGFQDELLEKVRALPGVEKSGLVSHLPLSGAYSSGTTRVRDSQTVPEDQRAVEIDRRQVSPDYFETMGIALLKGRTFTPADRSDSPLVAIVDEEFVKRFWPNEDPIGQFVSINSNPDGRIWREVVGVVAHSKHYSLSTVGREAVFFPLAQASNPNAFLVVRTSRDPLQMAASVRSQIWSIDSDQPISDIQSMEQRVTGALAQPRFNLLLLGFFASAALILATVGIYGVISYSVSQRNTEIGVRMALGASSNIVRLLVLKQGMGIVLIGLGMGVLAASLLSATLEAVLYDVPAIDYSTYAAVTILLALVAAMACYLPAHRATRIDPVRVLQSE